jgi:transposase-like protein
MRKPHTRRDEVLHRLSQPGAPSVGVLAEEVGVTKATIYGWLQGARKRALLAASQEPLGARQVTSRKGRERSPSEKLRLVNESESLKGEALAAFVRDNGTTVAELMTWRDLMLGGLERRADEHKTVSAERYDEVLKELNRKNAALAEAAAHLFLVKKVSRILDGEK